MKNITIKAQDDITLLTMGDILVTLAEDISVSEMIGELPIDGKRGFAVAFSNGFEAYIYRMKSGVVVEIGSTEPPEGVDYEP